MNERDLNRLQSACGKVLFVWKHGKLILFAVGVLALAALAHLWLVE